MQVQPIDNTNFKAQLWPKNNLAKFQCDKLVKSFTEKTSEYPNLTLAQITKPYMRHGKDVFKLYDSNMNEICTDTFEFHNKYSTPENLLSRYLEIFITMAESAINAGYKI